MAAAAEIAGPGDGLPAVPDFEDLYQQCYGRSVRLAWLLTHEAEVAEDIAQEAFVAVYRRFGEIHQPESFLYRTIVNQCRSWARRQAVKRRLTPAGREEHVDPAMGDPDLVAAVHRLPYR